MSDTFLNITLAVLLILSAFLLGVVVSRRPDSLLVALVVIVFVFLFSKRLFQ